MEKIDSVNNVVFVDELYDDVFNSVYIVEYNNIMNDYGHVDEKVLQFYANVISKVYISLMMDKKVQESVKNFLENIEDEIENAKKELKEKENIDVDIDFHSIEYLYSDKEEILDVLNLNSDLIKLYIDSYEETDDEFFIVGFGIEFEYNGKNYYADIKLMTFHRIFEMDENGKWVEVEIDSDVLIFFDYLNAKFSENITKKDILERVNKSNFEAVEVSLGNGIEYEGKVNTELKYKETEFEKKAKEFFDKLKEQTNNFILNLRLYIIEDYDNQSYLKFPYNKWKKEDLFLDGVLKIVSETSYGEHNEEIYNDVKNIYDEYKDLLIVNAGLIEKELEELFEKNKSNIDLEYFKIERIEYIYHQIDKDINFELDYDYYPVSHGFMLDIDGRKVFLSKLFNLPIFPIQFEDKLTENYVFSNTKIVDELYRLFVILTGMQQEVKYYNPYIMKEMNLNGEPLFNKFYIE